MPDSTGDFAWLASHARNIYSQFGEDGILEVIFHVIGTNNRWCFECGAADGIYFSNTRSLLHAGWSGALVEASPDSFERLKRNSAEFTGRVTCASGTADNLDLLLERLKAPIDLDLCVIDVDGQDYYLFNSLLRYQPRVILVEFDPTGDSDFIPDHKGPGQAGADAMSRLAEGHFYTEVHRTWCNMILVKQPLQRLLMQRNLERKTS